MRQSIPTDWTIQRSTRLFTKANVPAALLTHHNTAEGVFGQICVTEGVVTFFGFPDQETMEPEVTKTIKAGEFAITPPQYWHRVALSEDAQFNVNFWSNPDNKNGPLLNTR